MNFNSQKDPLLQLESLSNISRQSVVIHGPRGCGKSYLAKQYANMLGISDFVAVSPKVSEVKSALESTLTVENKVVLLIENLDLGVLGASYALLKSLEEPQPNVYIVVTCRSLEGIPDTIVSRSAVVPVCPPISDDLIAYASEKNFDRYHKLENSLLWRCVQSFEDVDNVLNMSTEECDYYNNIKEYCKFSDSVSNIVWAISHYPSNQDNILELAIRAIMEELHTPYVIRCGIDCIRDLTLGRIAKHAVLSKFIFDIKYCE